MQTIYKALLWLYPAKYRREFGREIVSVVLQTATERRKDGKLVYALFVVAEILGLISGAAAEWMAQNAAGRIPGRTTPLHNMTDAIARHDFLSARAWSMEDLKARRERTS